MSNFKSEPCATYYVTTADLDRVFDHPDILSQEALQESDDSGKVTLVRLKFPVVMEQAREIFHPGFPYPAKTPAILNRYGIREHKYIKMVWEMLRSAVDNGDLINNNKTKFPTQKSDRVGVGKKRPMTPPTVSKPNADDV